MTQTEALPSLAGAEFLRRPTTVRVLEALNRDGLETRAVGGAVRDALLGRTVRDIDLATTATPERVEALAREAGLAVAPTGLAHGTLTIIADCAPFQVTTLREDVETFGRHATVAFGEDWKADARRRDFTMNALYATADGTVFDPVGGYPDLLARRLRFIGDADARIREDYLRILRFFRFQSELDLGELDREGLDACARGAAGLAQLSAERVRAELLRLLSGPGAMRAVEAMLDFGVLVTVLGQAPRLAHLSRAIGIEESLGLAPDPVLRLAALAVYIEEDARRLSHRLRLSNAERRGLRDMAKHRLEIPDLDARSARARLYRLGKSAYRRSILAGWIRSGDTPDAAASRSLLDLAEIWAPPALPVNGQDLIEAGVPAGPRIGDTMRALESAWIESDFTLDRPALLARAKNLQ